MAFESRELGRPVVQQDSLPLHLCIGSNLRIHREALEVALRPVPDVTVVGLLPSDEAAPRRIAALSPAADVIALDLPNEDRMALAREIRRQVPGARIVSLGIDELRLLPIGTHERGRPKNNT